jgi:hypothetical protein
MPPSELFTTAEEYYATLLHEITHSTGHQRRLGRETIAEAAPFGSISYSKEELCAEMGSAFLCAEAGISPAVIENQAAYVAGWLKSFETIGGSWSTPQLKRKKPPTMFFGDPSNHFEFLHRSAIRRAMLPFGKEGLNQPRWKMFWFPR